MKESLAADAIWWTFSTGDFAKVISETIPWAGATFAASYAALYARFASQWAYLAGVYNQIMATQAQAPPTEAASERAFAAWKAGFIEDAEEVHLAMKPMFAAVIISFLESGEVRKAYIGNTPGGERRLRYLEQNVQAVFERENRKRSQAAG